MKGIVDDIVHRLGQDVRKAAEDFLVPVLLAVAGGLTGAAGAAFLMTWAYLTLSAGIGYGPAALVTGSGLAIVAAGLLVLARNHLAKQTAEDARFSQPEAPAMPKADLAAELAFTAAFVFARYLGESNRD